MPDDDEDDVEDKDDDNDDDNVTNRSKRLYRVDVQLLHLPHLVIKNSHDHYHHLNINDFQDDDHDTMCNSHHDKRLWCPTWS